MKKKKLKINVHRPVGTRFVFDEEGNTLPPLAKLAGVKSIPDLVQLDKDKSKCIRFFYGDFGCMLLKFCILRQSSLFGRMSFTPIYCLISHYRQQ